MRYHEIGKTGMKVSSLSSGASSLGGVFRDIKGKGGITVVFTAIEPDINFIDVSPYYGHYKVETILEKTLKNIPRDHYYLSTKVGRYRKDGINTWDYSTKRTAESIYGGMGRLNVDFIDLINVRDIEFIDLNQVVSETLPALVELRKKGVVGHVDITDLQLENLKWVINRSPAGTMESVLNLCHYCLCDDKLVNSLDYLEEKGIGIVNVSLLSMGLLTERGAPAWHPAPKSLAATCRKVMQRCKARNYPIEKLAMQLSVNNPRITTTLFSTVNPRNVKSNIAFIEVPMDEELVREVGRIIENQQRVSWADSQYRLIMNYTITDMHAYLWLRQDTTVDGLPIRTLENGRSLFMGEIRQMLPPFMVDRVNSAEVFLSDMGYAQVSAAVITREFIDGIQNDYPKEVVTRYPDRFFVCDMCEFHRPGYFKQTEQLVDNNFKAIKIPAHRLLLKEGWMMLNCEETIQIFGLTEERNIILSIDLAEGSTQIAEMEEIIAQYPRLKIAIERFGMVTLPKQEQQISLTYHPNVMIESGGIAWFFNEEFYPLKGAVRAIREATDLVGMGKLMQGSDYPRTITTITYKMSYGFITKSPKLTESEKAFFLEENTHNSYGFSNLRTLPYIRNMSE